MLTWHRNTEELTIEDNLSSSPMRPCWGRVQPVFDSEWQITECLGQASISQREVVGWQGQEALRMALRDA